ncbi:MAG: hypothetical protein AB1589_11425 [Cyanobacteriota bacterium]
MNQAVLEGRGLNPIIFGQKHYLQGLSVYPVGTLRMQDTPEQCPRTQPRAKTSCSSDDGIRFIHLTHDASFSNLQINPPKTSCF